MKSGTGNADRLLVDTIQSYLVCEVHLFWVDDHRSPASEPILEFLLVFDENSSRAQSRSRKIQGLFLTAGIFARQPLTGKIVEFSAAAKRGMAQLKKRMCNS